MNKKYAKVQSTRRSLIMSVLSLVLCFAMLLGTTYAWFTDEVTSGTNQIKAGNLDVELYHKDKAITGEAEKVTETVKLFDDVTLWEPGAYAYETFTIKNVGNLAFKYSMQINAYNATKVGDHSLDEVLKVAVVDTPPTSRQTYSDAVNLKSWSLKETEKPLYPVSNPVDNEKPSEKTFTVVVYWEPTDHDNDWNMNNANREAGNVLSVDLGINLVATQLQYESDSFGTDYDKTAAIDLPFIPMTKLLESTESLKIVVPQTEPSTEAPAQSTVKEATVPAAVANAVFNKVFDGSEATDKSLTLVLNVEEKSKTETTFNYDIDMDAVIKELTDGVVTKNETKSINELELTFTDFVEVQMKIDSGLSNVTVKHNGNDMTEAESKEAAKAATSEDPDGYFHYNTETGDLTLWTKTFSPFTVSGVKPFLKVVHSDGSETPYLPDNNLTKPKNFALKATSDTASTYGAISVKVADNDEIVLLDDCTVSGSSSWANTNSQVSADNAKDWCLGLLTYTLDLNGYTITASSSKYDSGVLNAGISIESGFGKANYTLNIIDRSAEKTGKIVVNGNGSLFKFESNNGNSVWTININGGTFIANNEAATLFAVNKFGNIGFKGINRTTNTLNINVNGGTFNRDITTETPYINSKVSSQTTYYPVKAAEGYTFGELGNGMYGLIASN